jgi:AcrR family transcriptional regulator
MQDIKKLPPYRQSLCEKILHTATDAFRKQGIRAVKMDDIAKRLSISKRTLYEIFSNKEALLFEVVKRRDEEINAELKRIALVQSNVMDVIIAFYKIKAEELRVTTPAFYEDIHRYPKVIKFLKKQHENSADSANDFFHRGVKEGYFRPEVNYEIISMMAEVEVNYTMSSKFYKKFSLLDIYKSVVLVTIRGFSTAKGLKMLENFESLDRNDHHSDK